MGWRFNWNNVDDWDSMYFSTKTDSEDQTKTDKVDEELKKQIAEGSTEKCTPIIPGLHHKLCLTLSHKNIALRFAAGTEQEISDMLDDFYTDDYYDSGEYYEDYDIAEVMDE